VPFSSAIDTADYRRSEVPRQNKSLLSGPV